MAAPRLRGLHHLKLPVTDLDASLVWYQQVFDAEHLTQFDHLGDDGVRYAVILAVPGLNVPIELRLAPKAAAATVGYDPVKNGSAGHYKGWFRVPSADRLVQQRRGQPRGDAAPGQRRLVHRRAGLRSGGRDVARPRRRRTRLRPRARRSPWNLLTNISQNNLGDLFERERALRRNPGFAGGSRRIVECTLRNARLCEAPCRLWE